MELIRLNKINLHRISELNRLFFLFCCTHENAPSGEIAGETEERNKELRAILFDAQEAFINANWYKCCSIVTDTTTYLVKEDVDYSMIPLKKERYDEIDFM